MLRTRSSACLRCGSERQYALWDGPISTCSPVGAFAKCFGERSRDNRRLGVVSVWDAPNDRRAHSGDRRPLAEETGEPEQERRRGRHAASRDHSLFGPAFATTAGQSTDGDAVQRHRGHEAHLSVDRFIQLSGNFEAAKSSNNSLASRAVRRPSCAT